MSTTVPRVAIVDYGLGNLYSVQRACENSGLESWLAHGPEELEAAEGIILPGVGAFGDAMDTLDRTGLSAALRESAASGKPLLGVCLGIQLLMTESQEFGRHEGLGIIRGTVLRLPGGEDGGRKLKVPQICWNAIRRPPVAASPDAWTSTPLEGLADGTPMYFVHSYYVQPEDSGVILAVTRYGPMEFCSGLRFGNTYAFQFHPERSGSDGLRLYRGFAALIGRARRT